MKVFKTVFTTVSGEEVKTIDLDKEINGVSITLTESQKPIVVNVDNFSPNIQQCLAAYGLRQKLGDSYARQMPIDEAEEKLTDLWETLKSDKWATGGAQIGLVAEAAVALGLAETVEAAKEALRGYTPARLTEFRANPHIQSAMSEITLQKAEAALARDKAAGIDTDGELDALMEMLRTRHKE